MREDSPVKQPANIKKKRYKEYILYLCCISLLFLVSELFYNYHGNNPLLYIKLSGLCLSNGQHSCEAFFLKEASNIRYRYYRNLYPEILNQKIDFSLNEGVLEKYKVNEDLFMNSKLTLIYYYTGLGAYLKGDTDTALSIWQKATYLDPDLSYPYVELSNLYLRSGNEDMARQTLERCARFIYPKKHCQEFLDANVSNNIYKTPGFLESEMLKINSI